ncbi:hypothetical protein KGF54_005277 [Candida jiufengensis]|uniref:uncharacterized protein n=1 Tax=Candida jiufengensis TaxID=497108 RepID=UPI002224F50E|nr:uncharacterized protein KGF54_005277 [Candida jiufengensis]KAI5950129.1 hypothetical protein KGF54_005277 [Candida jiufengensis]
MVGLFNKRRRPDSYQGFSKYAHEINQYHNNSQQHAGLPIQQQQSQQGVQRSQSLTSAGQAAAAALRLHSSPIKNHQNQQHQQYSNINNKSQYNHTAAQRQYGRSNSLSNNSDGRSNSLRQYTYHPQASYQVGQSSGKQQSTNTNNNNSEVRRYNSLGSNSRNNISRNNQSQQRSVQQQHQPQQRQQQQYIHEGIEEDDYPIHEEGEDEEEYVVTTTTTKVVDSQGRTQSIITKTIKTFPDGSNIIETATKNISRSNSRSNSLSSANFRSNSMTHQPINLTKIDEDLTNFDYDYQVDDLNDGNKLKLNTGESQNQQYQQLPQQQQQRDIIHEEDEEENVVVKPSELGEPFTDDLSKPKYLGASDRTNSITSQGKPIRSILKSQKPIDEFEESPSQQLQQHPVGVDNIPIAAAAAASAAPQAASNDVNEALPKNSKHPYQNLTQNTPTQSKTNKTKSPNFGPQSSSSRSNQNSRTVQPISSPKEGIHYSHSPGSSIKFDDKVETIPILSERSTYPQQQYSPPQQQQYQQQYQQYPQNHYQQNSPPTQNQYKSKGKKSTPPGPPSNQQPSADFYAAAMQAAYKKVYGDRDPNAVSPQQQPTSPTLANPSQQPLTPPQQPQEDHRKSKFGFIPLSPRKDQQQYESPQQIQQQPEQQRTSSINSFIRNKIQNDQKAAAQASNEKAIPSNYEYTNHHREFPLHSMRDQPKVANMRKEKLKEDTKLAKEQEKEQRQLAKENAKEQAKEEKQRAKEKEIEDKKLAKEQAELEKQRAKEQAEEEKLRAKEQKKRDKKPIFGGLFSRRKSQSGTSVYSNESNPVGGQRQTQRNSVEPTANNNVGTIPVVVEDSTPIDNTGLSNNQPQTTTIVTGTTYPDNTITETTIIEQEPIQNANTSKSAAGVDQSKGSTTREPIPETNLAPRPEISEPVKVERLGPALETQADNIVEEIQNEALENGVVNVEGVPISGETLGPNLNEIQEPLNEPEFLNPSNANIEPEILEEEEIEQVKGDPTHDVQLDNGESYKISVPRNHSYEDYRTPGEEINEFLPSPNIGQRDSKFIDDSYTTNNQAIESSNIPKVPKPELNEIDDDEYEQEEPSFKSYEKVEPPSKEVEEVYDIVDEQELRQLQADPNVKLEEVKPINPSSAIESKTPQVNAVPTFTSDETIQQPTTLDPSSPHQKLGHEVHPSAFVKDHKLSQPHENQTSDTFAGSQFIKKDQPQSKVSKNLPRSPQQPNFVTDEPPQQQQQPTSTSQTHGSETYAPPQEKKRETYSSVDQDSSAQPSADTLPTTQSKYGYDQQQQQQQPLQQVADTSYEQNGDHDVVIEEKKKGKSKKDKKPNKFKEKLFKYFVSAYDN